MLTAKKVVQQALNGNYIGLPYSRLDCQGLIKRILADAGEAHSARGSNYMWRYWLSSWGTKNGMLIEPGMLVFTIKNDGREVPRGYRDNRGNAAHVGLVVAENKVIHSSKGGVQWATVDDKRWTHTGKMSFVDYSPRDESRFDDKALIQSLKDIISKLEERTNDH